MCSFAPILDDFSKEPKNLIRKNVEHRLLHNHFYLSFFSGELFIFTNITYMWMTIPLIMEKYFDIFSSGNLNSNATKQNIKIRNPTGYAMGFFSTVFTIKGKYLAWKVRF